MIDFSYLTGELVHEWSRIPWEVSLIKQNLHSSTTHLVSYDYNFLTNQEFVGWRVPSGSSGGVCGFMVRRKGVPVLRIFGSRYMRCQPGQIIKIDISEARKKLIQD